MGKLFDADNQLSSSFTNQVYLDRDGFIWTATRNGLSRYDGYQHRIYKKENGGLCNVKMNDNNALKAYFAEVLPNYDKERVYVSNIKKVLAWYNILVEHKLVDLEEAPKQEEAKPENAE